MKDEKRLYQNLHHLIGDEQEYSLDDVVNETAGEGFGSKRHLSSSGAPRSRDPKW